MGKNPYDGNFSEVTVNAINKKEAIQILIYSLLVTFIFYFVLNYLNTSYIIPSTVSVTTSFLAAILTYKRSHYFALAYASNDVILIVLWILASLESLNYITVVICFIAFLFNDIYGYISWKKMKVRQMDE